MSGGFGNLQNKVRQSVYLGPGSTAMNSPEYSPLLGTPDKQGYLTKQGGLVRSWKKRWFILKNNYLYYFKSPNHLGDTKGAVSLEEVVAQRAQFPGKTDHGFTIRTPDRLYNIYADSEQDANEWVTAINKAASARSRSIAVQATMTYILVVKGIMCKCCHSAVKEVINSFPGVHDVVVNGDEDTVAISATDLDIHQVMERLEDSGYLPYLPQTAF